MAKTLRRIHIEKIDFASGALKTRDIPRQPFKDLIFQITMAHTNGASPVVTLATFLPIISKISLVLNGLTTRFSLSLEHLYYYNLLMFGIAPYTSFFTTASTAGESVMTLRLPFALMRSIMPEDTILEGSLSSTINLQVDWGTSMGTTTINSGEMKIVTEEYSGSDNVKDRAIHEMSFITSNLNKVGVINFDLEYGSNNQYSRLIMLTKNSSSVLANGLITKIGLRSRSFYYNDFDATMAQQIARQDFGIAIPDGVYPLNLISHGKQSQRLDARRLSELVLELTSTVTDGTVEILKDKVIYR